MYKELYHSVDSRYNLYDLLEGMEKQVRDRVEKQAQSVACLVHKGRLLPPDDLHVNTKQTLMLAQRLEQDCKQQGQEAHCLDALRADTKRGNRLFGGKTNSPHRCSLFI